MSYRNKTYVAFASEDIHFYRLMEAWRENEKIDFDFYDAHDLYVSRDTSKPETIKANLRERMKNAKQFVLLGSKDARRKGGDGTSFLAYEIQKLRIPQPLLDADYYTVSVSFQPKIIKYALDNYAVGYAGSSKTGPHYYTAEKYEKLGL